VTLFENPNENAKSALDQLGLGERLETILKEFDTEFAALKSYF